MPPPTPLIGSAAITENMLKRRWSLIVLRHLHQGTNDPAEVIKLEPGLSPPVINERLRTMVRYGLIARFPRPPPSSVIEYRLTVRGKRILEMLNRIEELDQVDVAPPASLPSVTPAPVNAAVGPPARSVSKPKPEPRKSKSTRSPNGSRPVRGALQTIATMKTAVIFLASVLAMSVALRAADSPPGESTGTTATQGGTESPASILATQVSEIASSTTLSRRAKAQRIAAAVRLAVTAAIAGQPDAASTLQVAVALVTAAAEAAPGFTESIIAGSVNIPALAAIQGSFAQLRTAALAGANLARNGQSVPGHPPPAPAGATNPTFGGNSGEVIVSPSH